MPVKIDPELELPEQFTEWRDDQYRAVEAITNSNKPHFLLDAPTGIGKSLIGIGAHKILKRRSIYLCGTKQLQDQVMRDFGDIAVTLKGRGNYPCALREDMFPELSAEDCQASKPQGCKRYTECLYYQLKEQAKEAPLVVLNNAYFLNEANGFNSSFTGAGLLVADEVDALDNALMNYIELKITTSQLERYGLPMPDEPEIKESWLKWIPRAVAHLEQQVSYAETSLQQCSFSNWQKPEIELNKKKKAMQKLIDKLSFIESEVDYSWIFYHEKTKTAEQYVFKPVNVGNYANHYLWDHAEYTVGMSGTIFDAETTCHELGIEECDYMRMDSPFPVENRPIYYKPVVSLSKKTVNEQLPILRDAVDVDLLKYPQQKVLIHTVSYLLRDYLLENLQCRDRLTTHDSDTRTEALEYFKTSRDPLVMLSPSFDRGVDLREADNCGAVMVCKMPYLYLGDPQVKAKVDSPGGWAWYALKAAQTLVQMTGRSVRSPRQVCHAYIYDEQFTRLRSQMRKVIPDWWLKAIQEVRPSLEKFGVLI